MEITLDELLASREERQARQLELLQRHPGATLVCLTVIMPGPVKRDIRSLVVAQAALDALLARFGGELKEIRTRDLPTGYEAYLLVSCSPEEAKRAVFLMEDTHPLGRMFDMDVLEATGRALSRTELGLEARRCLLCGREARWCMRNHTHTREELLAEIDRRIAAYVR